MLYNIVSGEGNGTPLQYSCLENPMDGGAWWGAVHRVAKSRTWLSNFTFTFHFTALEKEMATHSSVLAWRIPETGAAIYGVAPSWPRLKWLSSSSSWWPLTDTKLPDLTGGTVVKNPSANAAGADSIPESGRSPGAGNGNPLWFSFLKNFMDRGAWLAAVHGVVKSQTWVSDWAGMQAIGPETIVAAEDKSTHNLQS